MGDWGGRLIERTFQLHWFHSLTVQVDLGLLRVEVTRSHPITHLHTQSVGLLRPSDRPVAKTSTLQHMTLARDKQPCPGGIRTHNPSKRAAANSRLRPRGYRDRHWEIIRNKSFVACLNILSGWCVEEVRKRQEVYKGSKRPDRDSSYDVLKIRHGECCHT